MPQYKLADQAKAEALDREAVAQSAAGNQSGVVGDDCDGTVAAEPPIMR
jgi:hypothetical protein